MRMWTLSAVLLLAPVAPVARSADPAPTAPDEKVAKELSLAKAGAYLDAVSVKWTRDRQCLTCHTNVPFMLARAEGDGVKEVRAFTEDRAANWETKKPRTDTEVVVTGVALAAHDAATTGKLHPLTRKALDRMWTLQQEDGAWDWIKCDWPPLEHDDYYGATLAAVGVGLAPEGYADTPAAKEGLKKLRAYFAATNAPDLHHRTMLLWASARLDGLTSAEAKKAVVGELLAAQRRDGGWSLPSLGQYKRRNGDPNDPNAPSDGYATGLVVYALRQAGVPAENPALRKGATWLRSNQRESGRWYTRSLNNDKSHYITNAGTAFAVMALKACDGSQVRR